MNSNTPFYDFLSANDEMAGYFNSLPKNIQETIVQTGGDIKSISDLKSIAGNLLGENKTL